MTKPYEVTPMVHKHVSNLYEVCSQCRRAFRGMHWRLGVDRKAGVIVCNVCAPNRASAEILAARLVPIKGAVTK